MNDETKIQMIVSFIAMTVLLLVTQLGAVFIALPMAHAGYAAFEDPESLTNPIYFIVTLLIFTLVLLLLIRYRHSKIFSLIVWISIAIAFGYIFSGILFYITEDITILTIFTLFLAIASTYALYRYPEWYVIDILGVLMAAGIASIFGISLEPLPVIVLLVLLSVYDAISVYKTRHMITLADEVLSSKLPIMVMIPKKRGFSYIRDGAGSIEPVSLETGSGRRGAYFMGLGDLIMPAILVVSAGTYVTSGGVGPFSLTCITTMIGSVAGLFVLTLLLRNGRAHAGLPPLNGGAIIGCLIGILITTGI